MRRAEALDKLRALLPEVRSRFGVRDLSIFGSTARDEATDSSDIDILVDFDGPATFEGFFDLKFFLEDHIAARIDLVTRGALKPRIAPGILEEALRVA